MPALSPIDWSCPHTDTYGNNCQAEKGQKCREFESLFGSSHEIDTFHSERWEMAGGMSNHSAELSETAFNKDVLSTGLVY